MSAIVKPPYAIPSMADIRALAPNGFRVASLFAGCGGSCLGYRMAGYSVVWANEFIPAAQETYRANHPCCLLDGHDIRAIQPEEILASLGLATGELDVLDGSPPCASFSTSGKREQGWGKVKLYSDTAQRTDDLFFEYARILQGVRPKVFVAENVSGLVRGTAKGYFKAILAELKSCGYEVEARLVNAQWLGVPQSRERLIFVGVRSDLARRPAYPKPLPYAYTLRDACPWIESDKLRNKRTIRINSPNSAEDIAEVSIARYSIASLWDELTPGQTHVRRFNLSKAHPDRPCPTLTASNGGVGTAGVTHPFEKRKFTIAELKRISSFPDDFAITGTYQQQAERIGRAVPPMMMRAIATAIEENILCKL